jgi:hypothetical protein
LVMWYVADPHDRKAASLLFRVWHRWDASDLCSFVSGHLDKSYVSISAYKMLLVRRDAGVPSNYSYPNTVRKYLLKLSVKRIGNFYVCVTYHIETILF